MNKKPGILTDEQVERIRAIKEPEPLPVTLVKRNPVGEQFQPGDSRIVPNPGGKIAPRNKLVRNTLLKMLDLKPEDFDRFKPETVVEKIAHRFIKACLEGDGAHSSVVAAITALTERVDGSAKNAGDEDTDGSSGPRYIVSTIARPVIVTNSQVVIAVPKQEE